MKNNMTDLGKQFDRTKGIIYKRPGSITKKDLVTGFYKMYTKFLKSIIEEKNTLSWWQINICAHHPSFYLYKL